MLRRLVLRVFASRRGAPIPAGSAAVRQCDGASGSSSSDGSDSRQWRAVYADSRGKICAVREDSEAAAGRSRAASSSGSSLSGWPSKMYWRTMATFLPRGFPQSVAPGFGAYCGWQLVQMTAGTVTGVLSMQALLFAVGLGAGAIPLAAAINWILKDGLGQLGGVIYAAVFGGKFDDDPKRHRWFATVALQASTTLEVLTPMFPHLFLPFASIANVGKNVSYLAGSATRAQMHLSYVRNNNLGDITAKITSQSIAASLAGTSIGIGLSQLVGTAPAAVMGAFVPLSILTCYANYKSNAIVALPTLNIQRFELLLSDLLRQITLSSTAAGRMDNVNAAELQCATPHEVAELESFVWHPKQPFGAPLKINPDLEQFLMAHPHALTGFLGQQSTQVTPELLVSKQYALHAPPAGAVSLWFVDSSSAQDHFEGLLLASVVRLQRTSGPTDLAECNRWCTVNAQYIMDLAEAAGWKCNTVFLPNAERVIQFPK
eukprot:m.304263 g.304263  ORF g.304263 m.304263 type:complete len:488 (+) comp16730_c0_seq1:76-1539(+)